MKNKESIPALVARGMAYPALSGEERACSLGDLQKSEMGLTL